MPERIIIKDLKRALDEIDTGDYVLKNHLVRYQFAATLLAPGLRVLDIACGSGYGSKLLAQGGCEVVGADNSRKALALCRRYNSHKSIEWIQADIRELRMHFKENEFDAVVCLETLEHIPAGQEVVLEDFKHITKPHRPIITSIPLNHPDTIYHKRTFTFDQRNKLFENVFNSFDYSTENKSLVIAWSE